MGRTIVLAGVLCVALTGSALAAPQCQAMKADFHSLHQKLGEAMGRMIREAMLKEGFSQEQVNLVVARFKGISKLSVLLQDPDSIQRNSVEVTQLESHILQLAGCLSRKESQTK